MASTGSNLDAEYAGQNPDIVPMIMEIPIPRMILFNPKMILNPVIAPINRASK